MSGPENVEPTPLGSIPGSQVPDRAGITYRQFDYWVRRGYLKVHSEGFGSGYPREVTLREVEVARLMGELTAAGIDVVAAHRLAREIRATGMGRLGTFTIRRTPASTT